MQRFALSDQQWTLISDFLPKNGHRGTQWKNHRVIIDGILWILRTGAPWRDMPEIYGRWKTIYERFRLWTRSGLWDQIIDRLLALKNKDGQIDWDLFCIDGTIIRAHKASAGARKDPPEGEPEDHSLGLSRGGISTKIHLVCDGKGLPIIADIGPGQKHESTYCIRLVDCIRVGTDGRPKKRPDRLAGDKGYNAASIRLDLKNRGIFPVIPTNSTQTRLAGFDKTYYRKRNIVERCISWLKENRRIATRYEKLSIHFLAMLKIGIIARHLS